MADEDSCSGLYRVLLNRFRDLELSHAKLSEQFRMLLGETEKEQRRRRGEESSSSSLASSGCDHLPGYLLSKTPYRNVLESIEHAVYVSRIPSGDIIYWNHSAEKLYGWKDYEVLGRRASDLLILEENHASLKKIMEGLGTGQSWSGQFPFKKRSGEKFMAIVTESPLYEDGELVGVITVSSDEALFNSIIMEKVRQNLYRAHGQPRAQGLNVTKTQWQPRPHNSLVPQIASSVTNLTSKVFSVGFGEDICSDCVSTLKEEPVLHTEDLESVKAGKLEDTLFHRQADIIVQRDYGNVAECGSDFLISVLSISSNFVGVPETAMDHRPNNNSSQIQPDTVPYEASEAESTAKEPELLPFSTFLCSWESLVSVNASLSTNEDKESTSMIDWEIKWEDLHLGEIIGQGSFSVVYRGIWNGSDVAVKVYFANEYRQGILLDYKKEIGIMRRLRHPNVLLFMGAAYSPERFAIVTEFLHRGSLFKMLQKNNLSLDMRRRLRMALDVARGMNYLHNRNPPIVHRDLTSSNLLVDRNWTVKVGDFGLSKLKDATFLTAKSEGGTTQWMAPEVLRDEPADEKSDVFSFGVILWELMTKSIPWAHLNPLQVVGIVGFMDRRLEIPEGLDPRVSSIIHDCWQSDPDRRPSFKDIIIRTSELVQTATTVLAAES